jgi:glycosyltransferase involved in cell wall biosynthesis
VGKVNYSLETSIAGSGDDQVKPLLAYWVIGEEAVRQLKSTLKVQAYFDKAFNSYDKVLVTDINVKADMGMPVIVRNDLIQSGYIAMNRARNVCLQYALDKGYEWVILADADMVVVNPLRKTPVTGFSSVPQYRAKRGEISFKQPLKLEFEGSSYFVLHKKIFSRTPFCEDFLGYGFCDTDYCWNTLWFQGIKQSSNNVKAIHLWHEPRLPDRGHQTDRNRHLFIEKVKLSMLRSKIEPPYDKLDSYVNKELVDFRSRYGQELKSFRSRTARRVRHSAEEPITICIPYYNCIKYIRKSVESILNQTHANLTLIVVNDGDPQPPWRVLADIDDPRLIRFDLKKNHGRYFVDQVVLNATADKYLMIQDADDWSEPNRAKMLLKSIINNQSHGAISDVNQHDIFSDQIAYKGTLRFTGSKWSLDPIYRYRLSHFGLFSTDLLRSIGGPFMGFRIGCDTLMMNLLLMFSKISHVPFGLYNRIERPDSLSHSPKTGMGSQMRLTVRKRLADIYSTLYRDYLKYSKGILSLAELCEQIKVGCKANINVAQARALRRESHRLAYLMGKTKPQHTFAKSR